MFPSDSRNVLVCLRYGIGDVVMQLPAISALREALPDARITALANPPAHELLDGDPRVDEVVLTSNWRLGHRWDEGDDATRSEISGWLEDRGFDLAVDAIHSISAIATCVYDRGVASLESDAGAEREALAAGAGAVQSIRAGVGAGWGLDVPPEVEPELHIRPQHEATADAVLEQLGIGQEKPFVVSPIASLGLKRWPIERFAAVADRVAVEYGSPVLVLEGPDAEAGRGVVAAMRHPDSAVRLGPQHLLSTAAVLQRASAVICNDTGIMHMAAAVGAPTVSIFGPTLPEIFLPRAHSTVGLAPEGLACEYRTTSSVAPPACWSSDECLLGIGGCISGTSADRVMAALSTLLEKERAA